jgi:DNA invertase Pin-like site-specific DNA recombinase
MARKADERKREAARALYLQEWTVRAIGEALAADPATVSRWTRDIARPRGRRRRQDVSDDAVAALREAGMSYEAIGEALGAARMTAWRRLAEAGGRPRPDRPAKDGRDSASSD